MGSLSNLFISQSYISLLHLGSNNTASTSFTEIEDGLGNGIGVSVNTEGGVSASNLAITNNILAHRGLEVSGTVKINTAYTSSTPTYVNSGNYFTDSIIRITGSFASGSATSPTVNEVQIGWPVYGNGLTSGAVVTNKQYVNSQFVELTINQNTAVWFGDYYFTNPTTFYDNVSVSGSEDITGSLWVRDNITTTNISASGNISASNLYVSGTIYAFEIDTTIVSSSIVFTSGSNIIGDEANVDTQTLVGRVIVTGSLEVTSSIKATNDISSSTLNGIGNVTLYSQSVDNRLDLLENFSSSQYKTDSSSFDSRMDAQEAFSSSLQATFATQAELNLSSSQLQSNINTKLNTSSFDSYSASAATSLNNLSSSIYQTDATQSNNITTVSASAWGAFQSASAFSASAATSYIGLSNNNSFTGNQIFSGSVRGRVIELVVSSQTASMDLSLGNFFNLSLPTSSATFLNPSNIQPGETVILKVNQISNGTLRYPSSLKFVTGSSYTASVLSNVSDILTFVSFDTTSLFTVAVKSMA